MRFFLFIVSLLLSVSLPGQLPEAFYKKKKHLSFPVIYRHQAYAYIDLIREAGAGYEVRFNSMLALDMRGGYIYPGSFMKKVISANDFFYYKGGSVSLMPKLYFAPGKRWFVGFNLSYLSISYHQQWAEPVDGYNYDYYYIYGKSQLRDRKLQGVSFGPSFGTQLIYKGIYVEPFVSAGLFRGVSTVHVYNPSPTIILGAGAADQRSDYTDFSGLIGVKIGFGVSAHKKQVYDAIAQGYNAYFDQLDLRVAELFTNYQISRIALNQYTYIKRGSLKKIFRLHGPALKDTAKINIAIRQTKEKAERYLNNRTFLKGAYLDTLVTKDNRVIIRRRGGDLYEQRFRSDKAAKWFTRFRRPDYDYDKEIEE